MANAPNTLSTISQTSGRNKTSTAVSTNILIMVEGRAVGAIQTMTIDEKRPIKMVDEVGTDGHVDSVPTGSTNITGSCDRVRFDKLRIAEAFSRGFVHVASQVYPFDIVIIDKQRAGAQSISTVIKNVWIDGINYAYTANEWIITDKMTWQAERIYSHLNASTSSTSNGGSPVAQGGEIGVLHIGGGKKGVGIVNIEQLADTGTNGQGGSLDAAGLIDIGDNNSIF